MKEGRRSRRLAVLLAAFVLAGCATTVPYVGQGPHPQIQRGRPVLVIDTLGNVLAIIPKILLLDSRFANHAVSERTESYMAKYLDSHQTTVGGTTVQLNQYAPLHDFRHLARNHKIAWPYRILLGLPTTLITDVLLPGRLFPWGDYYNPWTDTVHVFSDHPAIGLHELGHAYDTNRRRWKGTYAAIRIIPFVDLYQEAQASKEAIRYLKEIEDHQAEVEAYRILGPAYGSYVGAYLFPPIGTVAGMFMGHVAGQSEAAWQQHKYRTQPDHTPTPHPAAIEKSAAQPAILSQPPQARGTGAAPSADIAESPAVSPTSPSESAEPAHSQSRQPSSEPPDATQ